MERKPNLILFHERKRRGWSQRKLADELNALASEGEEPGAATDDMVRKWEKGIHLPSPFYLSRLCLLFECTADQLGLEQVKPLLPPPLSPFPSINTATPALRLIHLVTVIDHWRTRFYALQVFIQQEMQNMDKISRRETLLALLALPGALMALNVVPPVEEVLARYAASITACWGLYYEGGVQEIKPYLDLHLPRLTALAKTPSKYQKGVAALASQAHQLVWQIALQDQDFGRALRATQEAALFGEIAGDSNLLLTSWVRRAQVYFHLKNPTQQMRQHETAHQYASNVSPLLKSFINMCMAENHASLHHPKEAERLLDLARKQFPDHPEEDLNASYVHATQYLLSINETRTYLRLAQPEKALDAIQRVESSIPDPDALVPQRVQLLNQRLIALCDLGELEEVCRLFEVAERGARSSKLRYNEVCEVYAAMCTKWPAEKRVLELETLLRR